VNTGLTFELGFTTVAWWAFLCAMWLIIRRCIGYRQLNTFSVFLPLTLATNGVLVPLTRELNEQITAFQTTTFDRYWLSLTLMYAVMPVGILLANLFKRKKELTDAQLDQTDVVGNPRGLRVYMLVVSIISVVSLFQIYLSGLGFDLYSYVTLKMDYAAYEAHRYGFAEATRGWAYFLYNKLPYGLAPLAIVLAWNAKGVSTWKRILFVGLVAFAILQTGHKMPLIVLAAFLALSPIMIRWRFRVSKAVIWSGVAVLLVTLLGVIPLFYIMQGEDSYASALFWSVERIFLEPSRVLQLYFETYPEIHPFLHGTSTGMIASLLGIKQYIPPSAYIPNEVLGIENTSFPALFIGEAWADFGYLGVAMASIGVGFLLQAYNVWYFNQEKPKLEEAALFISIVLSTIHLQASNLLTSLFSYGMLSSFLIYLLIRKQPIQLWAHRAEERSSIPWPDGAPRAQV
jgi:oligosaccharide repeat unit polymerase